MKKISKEEARSILKNNSVPINVDLGCGARKRSGYIGVDSANLEGVDIVCNLEQGLPFEDNIVDGVWSNFLFEHLPNTVFLFQELYRICKNNSIIEFKVPYYQSVTQYKDPTHKAIITPETMRYFTNHIWYGSDYSINTNFKVLKVTYEYLPPLHYLHRKELFLFKILLYPFLAFARRYLWNVVHSITIKIQVIK
ncbi:MAG TPA: methyltransferase domain-containing protein [Bacteroidia bacterium]